MSEGERPRAEPEIIPPDRDERHGRSFKPEARVFQEGFEQSHHIYVTRIGPFGGLWLALGIGALAVVVLVLIFGAFLFLIPLFGALFLVGVIARWWRGNSWRQP